jgi:ubiquinone/menaquinone biosynthesis C-methylase UbiE
LAAIRDGEDVLEVAVGTGLAFERILQANPSGRNEGIDLLINNYMFDLLPEQDFLTVLREFKRVLRPGGRLAMVNMTKGERWYNGIWNRIYRINPALLGGCRGVSLLPQLEACGFVKCKREYMSQFTFPSEIVYGIVA